MLYITQDPPPLRIGQEITGIRVIITSDPDMADVLFDKVSMDPTLTIGVTETEFPLEDMDYYVFTQAITNYGYTATTDYTIIHKKEDDDILLLTKLPINFAPDNDIYYMQEFHPITLFYLVGCTNMFTQPGCTYSYIIEHFDAGKFRVVYAEIDVIKNKVLVDVVLKHREIYRVTIITRYTNRSTTTNRYMIQTAPKLGLHLPIEPLNSSTDIINQQVDIGNLQFINSDGIPKLEIPEGHPGALVIVYDTTNTLIGYEYYYYSNPVKMLKVEGTI